MTGGMRRAATIGLIAAGLLSLAACAPQSAATATLGNRPVYSALGERERELAAATLQRAMERKISYRTRFWNNPRRDFSGWVTPLRSYRTESGFYCREFRETVLDRATEKTRSGTATACRDVDGVWKVVTPR